MSPKHYRTSLEDELARRCRRNPRYSLRSFAKALGMDVSTLSKVMSRKAHSSEAAAAGIASALGLPAAEASAFRSSAAEERRAAEVARLGGSPVNAPAAQGFDADPRWIAGALGVSQLEAKVATP